MNSLDLSDCKTITLLSFFRSIKILNDEDDDGDDGDDGDGGHDDGAGAFMTGIDQRFKARLAVLTCDDRVINQED